jgi:hypothetical protein
MRSVRITSLVLSSLLALPFVLAACGGDDGNDEDAEEFPTLQACFDEHHNMESLPTDQAIVVCCTDHPIAGVHPSCGATAMDCETHVDSELDDTSATADEITTACQEYIDQM